MAWLKVRRVDISWTTDNGDGECVAEATMNLRI